MKNKKIQAVIVVEGKKDTQRLRLIDPTVRTIETRGAAVNSQIIDQIKQLSKKEEIIILTDPDFSGERIRRIITKEIPTVKQAFLRQKDAIPSKNIHHSSLGVEHASDTSILQALNEGEQRVKNDPPLIKNSDLIRLKLINSPKAKKRRQLISDELNLGYVNGAHLAQRLRLMGISLKELEKIIEKKNYE